MTPTTATPDNPPETEALFPDGITPQVRMPTLSALCSFGQTPRIMTGALRQILLQHFAEPQNILSASLRDYLTREGAWKAGTDTGIYIESLARWRPELTEARPAIVLKEGVWKYKRLGIADHVGTDMRSGRATYEGYWFGSHTIFCLCDEGAQAQIIASEVAKLLVWFSPLIVDQLELYRFLVSSIGSLAAVKESTENYVVAVGLEYVAAESRNLQEEAPRLKTITFRTSEILDC